MEDAARHLALLTRTTEVVNSSLDLQEVMEAIAHEVAAALETDSAYVYLYDERTDELVLRATHGTSVAEPAKVPRMRRGEGITGAAAADRAPVMIASDAHLDPRFKAFPNLPEDDYASILAVPILAREKLEGALNVRTREPRAFTQAEVDLLMTIAGQVAQSIEHAKLYAQAQRRVHELEALARISEAVSESLYLEESLEAIVQTTVESTHATGAAVVLEDGRIAWPEGRAGKHAVRTAAALARSHDRRARRRPRHADSPTTIGSCSRRSRARRRSHSSTAGWRSAACSPRRSTIASRTTSRRSPRCCASRHESENVDPQKALGDSVNRILAIAAVHEVLTEHREDDVQLDELIDRLRAMLVQGLVVGKDVSSSLEPISLAGQRATSLALVFSELFGNALEHGGRNDLDYTHGARR